MPICPAEGCRQAIVDGEPTLKISQGELRRGKKSGNLYHSATFEEDILIHYRCVFNLFNPHADKEMYDEFRSRVERDVRSEMIDDLKQEALLQAAEDLKNLCPECLNSRLEDPDTPPDEYFCSGCGSAALPVCPDCGDVTDLVTNDLTGESEAA